MNRGTGAGDHIADLLFLLAFDKVVQMLRVEMRKANLDAEVCCDGADEFFGWDVSPADACVKVKLPDVAFADDLATVIVMESFPPDRFFGPNP